jgi:hypothetical protein
MTNECDWCYGPHSVVRCESYAKAVYSLATGITSIYDYEENDRTLYGLHPDPEMMLPSAVVPDGKLCHNKLRQAIESCLDLEKIAAYADRSTGAMGRGLKWMVACFGDPIIHLSGSQNKRLRLEEGYQNPISFT